MDRIIILICLHFGFEVEPRKVFTSAEACEEAGIEWLDTRPTRERYAFMCEELT
jgi:hypothetical protein